MFCMNCGQKLPEGAKFCKRCGTPLGAVSPDGVYTPDSDEDEEVSTKEGPRLGSFSVDGDDTGERLPQRSESSNNYFSMMGSANSNTVPPKEPTGPSPFKHTAEKKEADKAPATPSAFKPAAPAKEEAPKPATPVSSAFKPAASEKKEEAPKPSAPISSAFKPIEKKDEEPEKKPAEKSSSLRR